MQLFYREIGEGPPLIILHGLWGSSQVWSFVTPYLSDKYRIILPDLRNHGNSPHFSQMDYQVMYHDVVELIDHLNLPVKPHIAGHSMGGKVVMHLLLNAPEIVDKAIVMDIAPQCYPLDNEHLKILRFMQSHPARISISDISKQCTDDRMRQVLYANIHRHAWSVNVDAVGNYMGNLIGWKTEVAECNRPVLFIKGAESDYISDPAIVYRVFPNAEIQTIPNAGHWLHTEQPARLASLISTYLER